MMTDAEPIEAFRKALLKQAHEDFLHWAWSKVEFHHEYTRLGFPCDSFEDWVTKTYWGEVE